MNLFLVKFSTNWADEFDCDGFRIMTEAGVDEIKKWYAKPRGFFFGTNEGWEDEDFTGAFTITPITDVEAGVLFKHFLNMRYYAYGVFPDNYHEDLAADSEEEIAFDDNKVDWDAVRKSCIDAYEHATKTQ